MTKPTKWHVRQAKTQISLGIRPVWSESLLSAWRKLRSLATHWAHSEDSDQTGRMPRLIWVSAERTVILLVLSWGGSNVLLSDYASRSWFFFWINYKRKAGPDSSVGCASDYYSGGRVFWQHSFVEVGHEFISTTILSLPLVQAGHLSVTGERMCSKYWTA